MDTFILGFWDNTLAKIKFESNSIQNCINNLYVSMNRDEQLVREVPKRVNLMFQLLVIFVLYQRKPLHIRTMV